MKLFFWTWNAHWLRIGLTLGIMLSVVLLARFARYIKMVSKNDVDATLIPQILANNLPNILLLLLPLALMFGLALMMARLNNEGELSAWYNCGLSRIRLASWALAPSLVLLPLFFLLVFLWVPAGKARIENLLRQPNKGFWLQYINTSALATSNGQLIFADIVQYDKYQANLQNIQIAGRDHLGDNVIIVAQTGNLALNNRQEVFMSLEQGSIYRDKLNGRSRISHFTDFRRSLGQIQGRDSDLDDDLELIPSATLWRSKTLPARVELLWRFNMGIGMPILAFATLVAMGGGVPRRNWRATGLLYLVLIYWAYMSALAFMRDWSLTHSAQLSFGWVVSLFMLIQLIVLTFSGIAWRYQVRA